MKIFIDVDNTILEHSGFYSIETEQRIHSSIGKFPEENEKAIKIMYDSSICRNPDIIKKLFELDNVYILTKYIAIEYEYHKQFRIAQILGISHEDLVNKKDSNGFSKYICLESNESKVNVVKEIFKVDDISEYILIDDYSTNIIEWENNKGIAIKYYNEYNSPNHPIQGLSISNFRIFEPMIIQHNINDLMISSDDIYILNLFTKIFMQKENFFMLDILTEVYNNLKKTINIEKIDLKNKYDVRDFLIEYFYFMKTINEDYWNEIFREKLQCGDKFQLICASFDIDFKKFNVFCNENSASLRIIDSKYKKTSKIYDIYITLGDHAIISNVDKSIDDLICKLNKFIKVGD